MMDFSKMEVAQQANGKTKKVVKKTTPKKTTKVQDRDQNKTAVYSSIRHKSKGSDYTLYPKVFQGCEKCQTETLHIISKKHLKIRCTFCNHTYKIEVCQH